MSRPNNAFKPNPLRYAAQAAGKACHLVHSTARVGLTWVLGSMDRSQPTPEQVLGAVEESGFLLEHLIASILEQAGFHVETAWPFEDSESKKSREIDVRAIKAVHSSSDEDVQVFVELLIECEASKSPVRIYRTIQKQA